MGSSATLTQLGRTPGAASEQSLIQQEFLGAGSWSRPRAHRRGCAHAPSASPLPGVGHVMKNRPWVDQAVFTSLLGSALSWLWTESLVKYRTSLSLSAIIFNMGMSTALSKGSWG